MGTSIKPNGPNGMSSAAAALRYWERRQEVVSNNLANVSTGGFKGERVFSRLIEGALPAAESSTDFTPGSVQQTGNPYDVAIEGQGFMVVQTENGERLSRGGTMHLSEDGTIVDASGHALLSEKGAMRVARSPGEDISELTIGADGVVKMGKTELGQLRLEGVAKGTALTRDASGLFVPPATRSPIDPAMVKVRQGALEDSNVTPVSEMVDMIAIQRAYSAVQKAMSTLDATRGIATTELGRPAN